MTSGIDDLPCAELVELVTDFLEDALSDEDRTRVELHLVTCHGCDAYLAQVRRTLEAVRTTRDDPPDPAAVDALLDAFRDWRRRTEDEEA